MNKQILITGAARNTGYTTAMLYASRGWDVHITSRTLADAQRAAAEITEKYPAVKVYAYAADISKYEDITALFAAVKENAGRLDAFVANAAHLGVGADVFTTDEALFDAICDTNIKGTFFTCKEAARLMGTAGGSIVIMSSVQSKGAIEGRTVYALSKGALNVLSEFLAFDLAPYHIRCNTIIAGAIHTERWDVLDEATCAARRANYITGREADGIDIAEGIYFLTSDAAKSTTGTQLTIDSGVLVPILPYPSRKEYIHEGFSLVD